MNEAMHINNPAIDHIQSKADIPRPTSDDVKTPEAAREWAERTLIAETPRAAQEAIYQLRYGGTKERIEMMKQILDRSGIQGTQKIAHIAPVIVLTTEATNNLPWATRKTLSNSDSKALPAPGKTVIDAEFKE